MQVACFFSLLLFFVSGGKQASDRGVKQVGEKVQNNYETEKKCFLFAYKRGRRSFGVNFFFLAVPILPWCDFALTALVHLAHQLLISSSSATSRQVCPPFTIFNKLLFQSPRRYNTPAFCQCFFFFFNELGARQSTVFVLPKLSWWASLFPLCEL